LLSQALQLTSQATQANIMREAHAQALQNRPQFGYGGCAALERTEFENVSQQDLIE